LAQFSNALVVRSTIGEYPDELQDSAFEVDAGQAAIVVRERAEQAVRALLPPEERASLATVLLHHQGRLIGQVSLGHAHPAKVADTRRIAEEIAPFLASLIVEENEKSSAELRLRETEVLYEIAVTASGANTPTSLAARVVRELFPVMDVDHLGVAWLDGEQSILASHAGAGIRFIDAMTFTEGNGIPGWVRAGCPEIHIFSVADDSRCTPEQTLRLRVSSYCAVPIQFTDRAFGYVSAATHRVGGIDLPVLAMLRTVAAEMGQAISRLQGASESGSEGLMTANEFQRFVTETGEGCMVVLETLRKDQLFESFGRPAVDHALRQLAIHMRARLPQGGALCRRINGDFAAFLVGCDEAFASSWANEVAAGASMIALRTPDGRARIPLAIRARVARVTMKTPGLFSEVVA
jgi:hypothetical protein